MGDSASTVLKGVPCGGWRRTGRSGSIPQPTRCPAPPPSSLCCWHGAPICQSVWDALWSRPWDGMGQGRRGWHLFPTRQGQRRPSWHSGARGHRRQGQQWEGSQGAKAAGRTCICREGRAEAEVGWAGATQAQSHPPPWPAGSGSAVSGIMVSREEEKSEALWSSSLQGEPAPV